MTTAIIGFDRDIAEAIRAEIRSSKNKVRIYDTLPDAYSVGGEFVIRDSGDFRPDFIYYYSYFPNAYNFRKAIALSDVPSWPPVSQTILHDDKDLSLLQCVTDMRKWVDYTPNPRGYIPGPHTVRTGGEVIKWGNDHCGENKTLVSPGELIDVQGPALTEQFIEGESYRALLLGRGEQWVIHYESKDWRKNVNSTAKTLYKGSDIWRDPDKAHIKEVIRRGGFLKGFNLPVVGVDFIVPKDGGQPVFLELNCYPEIPDECKKQFIDNAVLEYEIFTTP